MKSIKSTLAKSLLFLFAITIFACNNESVDQEFSETLEKESFTKKFQITDDLGNYVNFSLISKEEDLIKDFTLDDFELFTRDKDQSIDPIQETSNEEEIEIETETEEWPEAILTLHIESYKMSDDITGFFVQPKIDESQAAPRWVSGYQTTANGVIGAGWRYAEESCSKERMQVQFHAKRDCFFCFYKKTFEQTLYNEGDQTQYSDSSIADEFDLVRLRYRFRNSCFWRFSGASVWWVF